MMAKNDKAAPCTALITMLVLVVSGIGIARAAMPELDDEEKALCEKKIEAEIDRLHKRFNEEQAKSAVLASDKVLSKLDGNVPKYYGTAFEGTFDRDCDLERFDGRMNLVLNTYMDDGKLYHDTLDVKFDTGDYGVKNVLKRKEVDRKNAGAIRSTNWAGYTLYDKAGSTYRGVDYSRVEFTVPDISDPDGLNCVGDTLSGCALTIWSGLSRHRDGNVRMGQTGVEAECVDTNCQGGEIYHMFTEIPKVQQVYCKRTVSAGDDMVSITTHSERGNDHTLGMWTMNYDTRQTCSSTKTSTSPLYRPLYAQYVVERPGSGTATEHLPAFEDFSMTGKIIRSDGVYGGIKGVYDEGDYYVRYMYNKPPLALNVAIGPVDTQDRFIVDYRTSRNT